MKTANIAEFKSHLSEYIHYAEAGERVQICKRNIAVAELVPLKKKHENKTQIGCGMASVTVHSDLTEPVFDENDWDMFKDPS
jgi:antitoxin (DNA-binding transcriptional repressor) of toxin-antitoxin stability system